MLHAVDDLPRADLQNIDARSTSAEDVLFIFADLKNTKKREKKRDVKRLYMSKISSLVLISATQPGKTNVLCLLWLWRRLTLMYLVTY